MRRLTRFYGPLVELSRLQGELNRLFSLFVESNKSVTSGSSWDPNVDVLEVAKEVRIVVEVPGLCPADLAVAAQGSRVRIRGSKRAEPPPGARPKYLCMERFFGEFEKVVPLPYAVNFKQASAMLHDGLLVVRLPRVLAERRHFVEIQIHVAEGNP